MHSFHTFLYCIIPYTHKKNKNIEKILLINKQKFKIYNFTSILQILGVIIIEVAAVEKKKKKVWTEITNNGV